MPKLVESYVEFFAKGLTEVEAQTRELAESSGNAHKAVDILSARFKTLYDKTLKQGITTTDTLFEHQRKIDNLFKKNEGMTKFIVDQQKLEKLQEVFNKTLDLETIKLKALDKEFLALSVAEHKLSENTNQANKSLALQVKAEILATGATKELIKAEIKLQAQEGALILQEKKLAATMLQSDIEYKKHASEIQKIVQAEKILAIQSQLLINTLNVADKVFIEMTAQEIKLSKVLENTTKELDLQAKQFLITSGAAKELLQQEKDLANFESILANQNSDIQKQLMQTNDQYREQSLSIEKNTMAQRNNQASMDLEMMKMKKLDGTVSEMSAGFMEMKDQMEMIDEQMNLNAKASMMESGYLEKSLQAHAELSVAKAVLAGKTQELTTNLVKNNDEYREQLLKLDQISQATKNSKMESELSIAKMREQDSTLIALVSTENNLQKSIEQSTKSLQLKAKALSLSSGATIESVMADKTLAAEESALNNGIAKLESTLFKTNSTFRKHTLSMEKDKIAGKALGDEHAMLVSKMMATDKEAIKNTANSQANMKATEAATKRLELQARQLNINSGAFKAQTKEAEALAKMEAKVAKQEEKIAARSKSGIFGNMFSKNKQQKTDQPAKIAIDTSSAPAAEKFTDRMIAKLGKLQTLALVAGGAIGGYVASFTAAASSNTLEAEKLGQAYEYAGRIVGDMFAPYVRSTTDLINKFSAYWKSLSSELKSSIAMWSMAAVGVATLVASLPILISIVSALIGAFTALLSPIALVGIALVGIGVYLSGVAEAGITMEKRITRAVRAVLDVFSLMQTVAESIWETLGPVFQNIVDGATTAFNWVLKQLGFVGEDGEKTSTLLGSSFSQAMLNCMEYFNKFKTFVMQIMQSIASTWKSWTDNFSLGLAAIAEKAGIVAQGTSKTLYEMNNESRKSFDAEQRKAMADMEKSNKDAMDRMRERLNQNKDKADEIAGPLIKMFKGLQSGKGFQMKMNVSFEGLQGTFDRLQQAFAQQVGPNIEQAQLSQLQGIHNNMQIAASSLVNIKDKIPAVR